MAARSIASASAYSVYPPASSSRARQDTPVRPPTSKVWVDPASLPDSGDVSTIHGNAPDYVKQLNNNTYYSYGVGDEHCFGYQVGKDVKFVDINIDRKLERQGRMEATTVAEVTVNKYMLNGAGMLHGGCIAYLIDK
ncbi:hypothetical protein V5O48_000354 [Marasmius crinis-equi]|uniref:Thioesterase domain-containing protein n=1 Tax=Marasmius crinis-equi TaxID=585013 RepID=A0ABR3G1H0_9AGAR